MTDTKLNISAEELAELLYRHHQKDHVCSIDDWKFCNALARRMLAADALVEAGREMLRVADVTDCEEPMTEQFDGTIRLNEALSNAQFAMVVALELAGTVRP